MKIFVISDTHSTKVQKSLLSELSKADLLIHLGDFCTQQDYEFFKKFKKIEAVYGNMDDPELRQSLAEKRIIELEGIRLGLFHGRGPSGRVLDFVREEFKDDKVDAVVFGHSHKPTQEIIEGVLYFNPGSPTDKIFAPCRSYGILTIEQGRVSGEIIQLETEE